MTSTEDLPEELRAACDKYHRGCGHKCLYHRAASEIEQLDLIVNPLKALAKIMPSREQMKDLFTYGYVPQPSHKFVDDGTGLCAHEYRDPIGEGLVRLQPCGLLEVQPEHNVEDKNAKN